MAKTRVPDKVIMQLMVRAGGRCQFPHCNRVLWRDGLTHAEINNAYVAHIIADSPDGPRGDPEQSRRLAKDFSNLMLLCADHHTLVDRELENYPVEMLRRFKADHERRIEDLTGLDESAGTYLLFFHGPIGNDTPVLTFQEARTAVLPRYPAEHGAIEIDLATSAGRDREGDYFELMQAEITRRVRYHVTERIGVQGINHLSIFALAPIPLLIHFGREVSSLVPADVYEYHRETGSWKWQPLPEENREYLIEPPVEPTRGGAVVLNLSLSGVIQAEEVATVMQEPYDVYTVRVENPYPGYLKSKDQLEFFEAKMRLLLGRIREIHGPNTVIHVFPALPAATAVKLGQLLLPKAYPPLRVYDQNRRCGGFRYALTVPRESDE